MRGLFSVSLTVAMLFTMTAQAGNESPTSQWISQSNAAQQIDLTQDGPPEKPVFGNWRGEIVGGPMEGASLEAQIVGLSWEDYRATITIIEDGEEKATYQATGKTEDKITYFTGGEGQPYSLQSRARFGIMQGTFSNEEETMPFTMERFLYEPPTRGKEPPQGAVVLLNESTSDLDDNWVVQPRWRLTDQGVMFIVGSSIITQDQFSDGYYHIEFRTPYMPNDRGQARGNSGVYVMGRYEIQVLDSFTDPPADNRCGGIYSQAVPIANPCLPPLEWQTYDIHFRAPRFNDSGQKIENARVTVKLNGTVIHDDIELTDRTPGGVGNGEAPEGVLLIQDHSDQVRFRNIWVAPLDTWEE